MVTCKEGKYKSKWKKNGVVSTQAASTVSLLETAGWDSRALTGTAHSPKG